MVFLGKSFNISIFMLFHSLGKITRDTNINCSISLTRKNVNISCFIYSFILDVS